MRWLAAIEQFEGRGFACFSPRVLFSAVFIRALSVIDTLVKLHFWRNRPVLVVVATYSRLIVGTLVPVLAFNFNCPSY